jgi:hypothetical protein
MVGLLGVRQQAATGEWLEDEIRNQQAAGSNPAPGSSVLNYF